MGGERGAELDVLSTVERAAASWVGDDAGVPEAANRRARRGSSRGSYGSVALTGASRIFTAAKSALWSEDLEFVSQSSSEQFNTYLCMYMGALDCRSSDIVDACETSCICSAACHLCPRVGRATRIRALSNRSLSPPFPQAPSPTSRPRLFVAKLFSVRRVFLRLQKHLHPHALSHPHPQQPFQQRLNH